MNAKPPIKVMPLGDSITSGTNAWASYRCALYQNLTSAGYSVDFVGSVHGQWGNSKANLTPPNTCSMLDWDQEGHSGWAIYHILNGVPGSQMSSRMVGRPAKDSTRRACSTLSPVRRARMRAISAGARRRLHSMMVRSAGPSL